MAQFRLELPKELSIYTVSSFREKLIKSLSTEDDLILDGSRTEKIDAAGIQLLLSMEKTVLKENFNLKLKNITGDCRERLKLAGVEELLMGVKGKDE